MNEVEQALFDLRSSGGKACLEKKGRDFYVKMAQKSAKVRQKKSLSTAESVTVDKPLDV